MVLDHHQRLAAPRGAVERLESGDQARPVAVGRIEGEKVVAGEVATVRPQPVDGIGACHVALLGEPGCGQNLGDDRSTGSIPLHECRRRRAARERLDAKGPGAREQIEYARTAYAVADDVEQGLADP